MMAEVPAFFAGLTLPANHSDIVLTADAFKSFVASSTPLISLLGGPLSTGWSTFISSAEAFGTLATPIAQQLTFFRLPALETAADGLAASVGQDPATLRYLLTLLVAYPLALVFANLRFPILKNIFSLVTGVFLAQFVFGSDWCHCLLAAAVSYALFIVTAPIRNVKGLAILTALLPFAWMMGYLTVQHLYRLHVDYMGWSLDVTGPMMILVMKLTSLGFSLYDGSALMSAYYKKKIAEGHPMKRVFADRLARCVPTGFRGGSALASSWNTTRVADDTELLLVCSQGERV